MSDFMNSGQARLGMIEFVEDRGRRIIRFDYSLKRFYVHQSTYSREVNMLLPLIEDASYKNRAMAMGYSHKDMYRYIKAENPKVKSEKPKQKKVLKPKGMFIKI